MWKGNIPKDSPSGLQLPIHIDKCYEQRKGDALSCGLARPHGFISGKPIQVTFSHGPGIEPCRCMGNTVLDA
jgi:hypothetical protein